MTPAARDAAAQSSGDASGLEPLLEYLKRNRGFDFTGYKRTSLERRIAKRMNAVGVDAYDEYQRPPRGHPGRVHRPLQHDPDQRHGLLPRRAGVGLPRAGDRAADAGGDPDAEPIRVWSRGCASGEEAYTVAMVLAEALGEEAFKRAREDLRHGRRRGRALPRTPGRSTRATRSSACRTTSRDRVLRAGADRLRRSARTCAASVIFGRNDLVAGRADLAHRPARVAATRSCTSRAETQARILGHFNFALNDGRLPVPGQVGDADHPLRPVHAGTTSGGGCSGRCRATACATACVRDRGAGCQSRARTATASCVTGAFDVGRRGAGGGRPDGDRVRGQPGGARRCSA